MLWSGSKMIVCVLLLRELLPRDRPVRRHNTLGRLTPTAAPSWSPGTTRQHPREFDTNNTHTIIFDPLTHWGRVTHLCVGNLTIIGSDNGLSPGRRQAIIWTSAGILLTGPLGTNFSEVLIGIQTFSLKKMHLKMSSAKWRPFVSASMC